MNELVEIQVRIKNKDTGKTEFIHHKVAHALSLRDGGEYSCQTFTEACSASYRYHERLKERY